MAGLRLAGLTLLLCCLTARPGEAQVPGLTLNGADFSNHRVINKDPSVIGEGANALYCNSNDDMCCGTLPSGNGRGNWFFPNGNVLTSSTSQNLWYASWLTGAVLMNFRGNATTGTTGLHRCDILDSTGTLHQFYTCIYAEAGSNIFPCSMTSVAPLQFSLTADPSVFTLNCITTGGPPTVTWTRDGNNVPYDATHVLTQTVTDQENVIYSNVLTVTGSESGIYTCIVTNDRTAPPIVSQELTVVGAPTITGQLEFSLTSALTAASPVFTLTCVSTGGPATTVTWTLDGAAAAGATSQTVVDQVTTNTLTVTGRLPGVYECRVENDRGSDAEARTVTEAGAPSGVSFTLDGTTITVTWTPPSPAPSNGYMVYYTDFYSPSRHAGSVSVSSGSDSQVVIPVTEIVYRVSVVAVSDLPSAEDEAVPDPYAEIFGQVLLPDHSLVDNTVMRLRCMTGRMDCCISADTEWYLPSGDAASSATTSSYGGGSDRGAIELRSGNSESLMEGIHRCTLPESDPATNPSPISIYIGIYDPGQGALNTITDNITFALVSSSPVQFSLTCTSTGGPATSVTWTRNGVNVNYDSNHVLTRTVVNTMTAQYSNTLTVTGVEGGSYRCIVSNVRGAVMSPVLSGDVPSVPIGVTAFEPTNSSVRVTWTAPSSAGSIALLGYRVSFERLINGVGCDSPHNDTESVGSTTTDYTVTGLSGFSTYRIGVSAGNIFGSSMDVSNILDTLSSPPTAPPDGVTTATSGISITVSWSPVPCLQRNSEITGWVVRYTEVTSRRATSAEMNVADGSATSTTIDGLKVSVRYSIQVAAMGAGVAGVFSDPVIADETVPTPPPPPPSPTPTETPEPSPTSTGTSPPGAANVGGIVGGIIVAIVVVVVLVVALVILGVWFWRRRSSTSGHKYVPATTPAVAAKPARPPPTRPPPADPVRYNKATDEINGTSAEEKMTEPVIQEFPQDAHVTEGQGVVLQVKVAGVPSPMLTWCRDGTEVKPDYSVEIGEDGTLKILSAESKHMGTYQLVAANRAGSMEREVKVYVHKEGGETPAIPKRMKTRLDPISVSEFGQHVADSHSVNNRGFRDQYASLESGEEHGVTVAVTPNNKPLNRFANITVYDDNRISLQPIPGHSDHHNDYVNACYIDGYNLPRKFIATQGPLPKTLVDFWRVVWQERPPTIVMVTNVKEGNKFKSQQYWPESGSKLFGPFKVSITDQQSFADYTIRTLLITLDKNAEHSHKVTQFHFVAWPDHGVPDYATPILAFHRRVRSHHKPSRGPLLVHCSAGVGRTGTYVTIDRVLDQINAEGVIDIAGTINSIRHQRMKMVQTVEQYIFIHDAILESVTCGDTQIAASNLRMALRKLEVKDRQTGETGFQSQFHVLDQVSPKPNEVRRESALQHRELNRSLDFLPPDQHRVVLKGTFPDYIHATSVNGYKQKKAFIVAEGPTDGTARSFLKAIYDRRCGAVVLLSALEEGGQEVCYQYWPTHGIIQIGEFTVDLLEEEHLEGFTIRRLSLLDASTNKAHQVIQFHIHNWEPSGHCSNYKAVTDVIDEVGKVQRRTGNRPIVIHCSDTVSRSGMFCAIATTIDRCKSEGVVDVFQVVKALRVQKPGSIRSLDQYCSVFDAVLVYLDAFDTYANFE